MIVAYSAAQIRAAEEPHLAAGEPLMERAAGALAEKIRTCSGNAVTTGTWIPDRRGSCF